MATMMMVLLFCGTALAVTKVRRVRRDRQLLQAYGPNNVEGEVENTLRFGLHITALPGVEIESTISNKIKTEWIKYGPCSRDICDGYLSPDICDGYLSSGKPAPHAHTGCSKTDAAAAPCKCEYKKDPVNNLFVCMELGARTRSLSARS